MGSSLESGAHLMLQLMQDYDFRLTPQRRGRVRSWERG